MSPFAFFLTMGLFLGTALLIFAMKYVAMVQAARSRAAEELNLRGMAERTARLQVETSAALTAIQASLGELGAQLSRIEKVLKEVE